jgi:hypothetical protein
VLPLFCLTALNNDAHAQLVDTPSLGTFIRIDSDSSWSATILDSGFDSATQDGVLHKIIPIDCSQGMGIYSAIAQKSGETGWLKISMIKDGNVLDTKETTAAYGVVMISGICK